MYYNDEHYEVDKYGDKTIRRESVIVQQDVNKYVPSYYQFKLESNELNDNSNYLQLLGPTITNFYNHNIDIKIADSTWSEFPTEDEPFNKYKFVSFDVVRDSDLRKIQRKTYGIFEWLADIGGMSRAVFAVGNVLMGPLTAFQLHSLMAQFLVRVIPSSNQKNNKECRENDFYSKYGVDGFTYDKDQERKKELLKTLQKDQIADERF